LPQLVGKHKYSNACLGSIAIESNGYQGGDGGHGGYLGITFDTENQSTSLSINSDGEINEPKKVTLTFRGDAEIKSAPECLEFAVRFLQENRLGE
jgi:hypothetical protein